MLLSTVKQLAAFHSPIPSAIQLCANSGFPAMYMTQTHQINFVCAVYVLVFNPWLTEWAWSTWLCGSEIVHWFVGFVSPPNMCRL